MTQARSKLIGALIGIPLMAAAVYSVFFVDWSKEVQLEPPPIRPIKMITVGDPFERLGRQFPGKVRPNQQVDLAFQVSGPLIELVVRKGDEVEQGALIGRIDPRDYQSTLDAKEAILEKARSDYEKIQRLFEEGNAGKQEVVDNKSDYDVALAERDIAAKALSDTYLRAPFSGRIANTFVDNFQDVAAKKPIASLQDVASVEIEVNVPEQFVALANQDRDAYRFAARFDYLPERQFDVTISEFTTEADPATQTFAATFVMASPEDVNILPGMTATVVNLTPQAHRASSCYAIPADALVADTDERYFVWRILPQGNRTGRAEKVNVAVEDLQGDWACVAEPLQVGERIAAAGVHLLREGQIVRLPDNGTGE